MLRTLGSTMISNTSDGLRINLPNSLQFPESSARATTMLHICPHIHTHIKNISNLCTINNVSLARNLNSEQHLN